MTYDETLDVKPSKVGGSKSVQQLDGIGPDKDFDSKSEMALAKSHHRESRKKQKHADDDQLDLEAVKQEKHES